MGRSGRHRTGRLALALGVALSALLLSATTASPTAVTTSPKVDPTAFSGLGDLAFDSDSNLYVLDGSTGTLREVATDVPSYPGPAYGDGGNWLLFTGLNGRSYLAAADGTHPEELIGQADWLPDGKLAITNPASVTAVDSISVSGSPLPTSLNTATLPAATNGTLDVYLTTPGKPITAMRPAKWTVNVETSTRPNGPRTLWYTAKEWFTVKGGLEGTFVGNVDALPNGLGLLMTIEQSCCDYADGQTVYELRRPGGAPIRLGNTTDFAPTIGPDNSFALSLGGDRYAWSSRSVRLCDAVTANCTAETNASREVSLSPEWSPNHLSLVFVEARNEPEEAIGQPQIDAWYATHDLYLLDLGSKRPREIPGTQGAADPVWSRNGVLLYVDRNALYLLRKVGDRPVEIAGPLFEGDVLPAYYGQVDWSRAFSWSHAA